MGERAENLDWFIEINVHVREPYSENLSKVSEYLKLRGVAPTKTFGAAFTACMPFSLVLDLVHNDGVKFLMDTEYLRLGSEYQFPRDPHFVTATPTLPCAFNKLDQSLREAACEWDIRHDKLSACLRPGIPETVDVLIATDDDGNSVLDWLEHRRFEVVDRTDSHSMVDAKGLHISWLALISEMPTVLSVADLSENTAARIEREHAHANGDLSIAAASDRHSPWNSIVYISLITPTPDQTENMVPSSSHTITAPPSVGGSTLNKWRVLALMSIGITAVAAGIFFIGRGRPWQREVSTYDMRKPSDKDIYP